MAKIAGRPLAEKQHERQHHNGGQRREGKVVFAVVNRKLQPFVILPHIQPPGKPGHGLKGIAVPAVIGKQCAAKKRMYKYVAQQHQSRYAEHTGIDASEFFKQFFHRPMILSKPQIIKLCVLPARSTGPPSSLRGTPLLWACSIHRTRQTAL